MSELKTNIMQKPVEDPMLCIACNQITRCNYNLTGRKDPLCEECYLKQLSPPINPHLEKEITKDGFTFRIFKLSDENFSVESDEAAYKHHKHLHFALEGTFRDLADAEDCVTSFLARRR